MLNNYYNTFVNSLVGQSIATYVLGIKDRHPSNFMIHINSGKFFHIDFGHFMGHVKVACGGCLQRDREPFIYSDELFFVVT